MEFFWDGSRGLGDELITGPMHGLLCLEMGESLGSKASPSVNFDLDVVY